MGALMGAFHAAGNVSVVLLTLSPTFRPAIPDIVTALKVHAPLLARPIPSSLPSRVNYVE
jgi:hypothetical protein